ncbi:ferritin-like protein [Mucilaginibacter sp. ZT4R22]|uniref:Ferritin-like protein n=1 Tax=Mucilaginibacter pankratovii TaxID=2772110 RepID=A0ABR7WSY2_9SPHI|nr:ferritin-like protein [Mucilaginibacter pankratovii]MBD1365380.1 ferritin-like protein [Mucilaginibacter pankratovii]
MIDTREELLNALAEAAELEHGLLVQYLFTAFSFKRRLDEGITPLQQLMMEDWERTILSVAHQEMYHLANVCNLLAAIGGAPRFDRPNFPQPLKKYYPFDFELTRFGDEALYRFIVFELPEGVEPPPLPHVPGNVKTFAFEKIAPDPLVYNHIGELYERIAEGFKNIPENVLFIGPEDQQDIDEWTLRLKMHKVHDRASALEAIKEIVEEGEGTKADRAGSHYDKFLRIRQAYLAEKAKDASFEPARNVATNPRTREHRDAGGEGTIITHQATLKLAELFNTTYTTMLSMLIQYYSYGGETQEQREILRDSSRRMMSAFIRPMAEVLTEMPVTDDLTDGVAGAGFELYGPMNYSGQLKSRWIILQERFRQHIADIEEILEFQNEFPVLQRIAKLRENYEGTLINLKNFF